MKIKKGDHVSIISGKDKGKSGKTIEVFLKTKRVLVEGVNIRKKHVKPKKEGEKGQIVQTPCSIHISNVKLICPKCNKATRVGHKVVEKRKFRICKKCKAEI
ncbi:MAG: 50S ribosomal protein L24 [Patescibacteria group bacterium]|nr:50S ribosomal protein L24 [Patescibacteria group bacterium]